MCHCVTWMEGGGKCTGGGMLTAIVCEHLEGPLVSLENWAKDKASLVERDAVWYVIVRDTLCALACFQRAGWIHRDVKLANLGVRWGSALASFAPGDGEQPSKEALALEVVLFDVEFAAQVRHVPEECTWEAVCTDGMRCGTKGHIAPEKAAGRAHGLSSDVYAMGAMLREKCDDGWYPSGTWLELVCERSTHPDPAQRPTVDELQRECQA